MSCVAVHFIDFFAGTGRFILVVGFWHFVSSVFGLILGVLEGFGLGFLGRLSPPIAEGEGKGGKEREKRWKARQGVVWSRTEGVCG